MIIINNDETRFASVMSSESRIGSSAWHGMTNVSRCFFLLPDCVPVIAYYHTR